MKMIHPAKQATAATAAVFMLASTQAALAKQACFTAFGGTVNYQFDGSVTTLQATGYHPLTGVTFGALTSCAGLTHWAVMGSAYTESTSIVMGWRSETVDANNCGAVDFIVNLDPATMTGSLQLYNERTGFGNSDTLTKAKCQTVPPAHRGGAIAPSGRRDMFGN
jgi:hypothetical protein